MTRGDGSHSRAALMRQPTIAPASRRRRPELTSRNIRPSGRGFGAGSATGFQWSALATLSAIYFAVIIDPINLYLAPIRTSATVIEAGIANRIFWPLIVFVALIQLRNVQIAGKSNIPPHLRFLFLYCVYAGLSITWALKPEASAVRYIQQLFVLTVMILPALTAPDPPDIIPGLAICLLIAVILNVGFVIFAPPPNLIAIGGHLGYFAGKNYLGEFSVIACQVGWYGVRSKGFRRVAGIATLVLALTLLVLANSKTAIALCFILPPLAWAMGRAWRHLRISPAIFLALLIIAYNAMSSVTGITTSRLGYIFYGDPTFTGRTIIWEFVNTKIAERPWLGWGYQSFWLIGPESPAVTQAPGWVKKMPNGHNGYIDTMLELGYVGYGFLLLFVFSTLHGVRVVISRDPIRGQLLLTLLLLVFFHNMLESLWMRGYEIKWLIFLIVAADIARYWNMKRPGSMSILRPVHK